MPPASLASKRNTHQFICQFGNILLGKYVRFILGKLNDIHLFNNFLITFHSIFFITENIRTIVDVERNNFTNALGFSDYAVCVFSAYIFA